MVICDDELNSLNLWLSLSKEDFNEWQNDTNLTKLTLFCFLQTLKAILCRENTASKTPLQHRIRTPRAAQTGQTHERARAHSHRHTVNTDLFAV